MNYEIELKNGSKIKCDEISFYGDLTYIETKCWYNRSKKKIGIVWSSDISIININNVTDANKDMLKSVFNIPPGTEDNDDKTIESSDDISLEYKALSVNEMMYN